MLMGLRNIPSGKLFSALREHNAAELLRSRTLEETVALLEPLDHMSRFISVQRAIYEICGDAPEHWVSTARSLGSLLMSVKAGKCPRKE
mgnify:FL=1